MRANRRSTIGILHAPMWERMGAKWPREIAEELTRLWHIEDAAREFEQILGKLIKADQTDLVSTDEIVAEALCERMNNLKRALLYETEPFDEKSGTFDAGRDPGAGSDLP